MMNNSIYTITLNDEIIHDSLSANMHLGNAHLQIKKNEPSILSFSIYVDHPKFSDFLTVSTRKHVTLYNNDRILFRGFPISSKQSINGELKVECADLLQIMSFVKLPPMPKSNDSINGLVRIFYDEYTKYMNAIDDSWLKMDLGNIEGDLIKNEVITYEYSGYTDPLSDMKDLFLDVYPCAIRIRYENDHTRMDILSESIQGPKQTYRFGESIVDYSCDLASSDSYTSVMISGSTYKNWSGLSYNDGYTLVGSGEAKMSGVSYYYLTSDGYSPCPDDEDTWIEYRDARILYTYESSTDQSEYRRTIKNADIPDGELGLFPGFFKNDSMIFREESVLKYGMKIGIIDDETIKDKDDMVREAIKFLEEHKMEPSIEARVVDLYYLDESETMLSVGDYVRIIDEKATLDETLVCSAIDLDINSPTNSAYTFGKIPKTLTSILRKRM